MDKIQMNPLGNFVPGSLEAKKQATAQDFVKNFFAQNIGMMLKTSTEENYERDMYMSFLSEAIGEKISTSPAAAPMVSQIYRHMAGIKGGSFQPPILHTENLGEV